MKIIIVAATESEMNSLQLSGDIQYPNLEISQVVTGPGIMNTAFILGKMFNQEHYDMAINAGIAGSFRKILKPGVVVKVISEIVSEMGAEDGVDFLTAFDLGLIGKNEFPYSKGKLLNDTVIESDTHRRLSPVNGITVNSVHGKVNSIQKVLHQFKPDIETMEGAAFFYSCLIEKIPFLEIRAISNYIERRDRSAWKMKKALDSLGETMRNILEDLNAKPLSQQQV